jgi:hypothetical protein
MFSCAKCKREDQSGLSVPNSKDYFCSECFKTQIYDKFRREISKGRRHPKKVERILILHDRSLNSEIILALINHLWELEPSRKNIEQYFLYYPHAASDSDSACSNGQFETVTEFDPNDFDRIFHPPSMNDLSKRFFSEICNATPHEIPKTFQSDRSVFPLANITDEDLQRTFSLFYPGRSCSFSPAELKPLDKLVGAFIADLTKEKPSTCNIIYKSCRKLS